MRQRRKSSRSALAFSVLVLCAGYAAKARAEPGKLNWASGTGLTDFLIASFLDHAHLEMSRVPYRDAVQQPATDLAEGRIHLYVGGLPILQPHVQNGKVRVIAVTNSVRIPGEADIPTVTEAGFPALAAYLSGPKGGLVVRGCGAQEGHTRYLPGLERACSG